MRLLIPILLLAGLGVGYLAFRRDAEPASIGTGPASRAAATTTPQAPLELERGSANAARSAAEGVEPNSVAGAAAAGAAATEIVDPGAEKDPTFVNGVTMDPLGSKISQAGNQYYIDKYRDASRASRVQAFESLRAAVDIEFQAGAKDSAALAAEMKREMEWLQDNYEPETP